MATQTQTQTLANEIRTLEATEVAIETNSGTYGAAEACRAVGCGSPEFADYTVYERVGDGTRRVVGCDPGRAPGRARHVGRDEMAMARAKLTRLRAMARAERRSR